MFVGSRAGDLWVLNQHGSPIGQFPMDGWVGALEVVEAPAPHGGLFLMAGTKKGRFSCFGVELGLDEAHLHEHFSFAAGNTLREIDCWASGSEVLVAAGSEDRHVYLATLAEMTGGDGGEVRKVGVNGWIRSVAFCSNPAERGPAIAAGCGDKHVYFLSPDDFDRPSGPLRKVFVDAKVHCIVGDPTSATVFCASDARRLSVIGWTGDDYGEIDAITLPHRATRMTFADDQRRHLLTACEDGNVYVYDVAGRQLVSYLPVGERVFALRGIGGGSSEMLVGKAYGRLSCSFYSIEPGIPRPLQPPSGNLLEELASNDFAGLARSLLFGPVRQAVELGIGRFIHLTDPAPEGVACVVGTDGGDVCILRVQERRAQIIHRESFEKLRVWAVDAAWEKPGTLRVLAATSHSNVISYELDVGITPPEVVGREESGLEDWPREIRPVLGAADGERRTLVCCENGDLIIDGREPLRFNTGQVLRSGYAKAMDGYYDILTGSDDCLITRYRDDEERWRYAADDRVREVIIEDEECVAVSEDRFLYVLSDEGKIRWRFRFPHRALCVDIHRDRDGRKQYVVGCGDGGVYFVDEDGIGNGYLYPDRIRDVRLLGNGDLAVACEDGLLYFSPTVDRFLWEHCQDQQGALIDERVVALRAQVRDDGLEVISDLLPEERLLLLRHLGDWFGTLDAEMAMALIDAAAADVLERDHISLYYLFGRALVEVSRRANLAAGRSRIEGHLRANSNNPFVVHALLSTIALREVDSAWPDDLRVLTDTIVVNVPLEDEWIREELVRHLDRGGFFSLRSGGFNQYFRAVRIRYQMLARIIEAAGEGGHEFAGDSALPQLLAYLQDPRAERAGFDRLRARIDRERPIAIVREGLDLIERLIWGDGGPANPLGEVRDWILAHVGTQDAVEAMMTPLTRHEIDGSLDGYGIGLLAEVLEGRLRAGDPKLSGVEYLALRLSLGFILAIGVRTSSLTLDGR